MHRCFLSTAMYSAPLFLFSWLLSLLFSSLKQHTIVFLFLEQFLVLTLHLYAIFFFSILFFCELYFLLILIFLGDRCTIVEIRVIKAVERQ